MKNSVFDAKNLVAAVLCAFLVIACSDNDQTDVGGPAGNADIVALIVAGQTAILGAPAESYSAVTSPGSVTVSTLMAESATVTVTAAPGATVKTAKVTSGGAPQWSDSVLPSYSFADGDFLYIEVTAADDQTVNVYKIIVTLGTFVPPELTSFTLINATAQQGVTGNKTGSINQSTGVITFSDTSFTTVSVNTVISFHNLAAHFTISPGSKLYVGDVEQISGTTTNNYYQPVTFTVVSGDNARKTYTVAGPANYRIVGTQNFQTQGFGVMSITTTDKTTGLPANSPAPGKLNNIWNTTGAYTYIGPEGRALTGRTDVRARGNHSFRADTRKSYAMKLPSSARVGFDYYNFKTRQFDILPAHRRWALLAHETDTSKIRTTTGYEMGRHVLTKMGWQPHGDFVFFFLNDEFKGVYILSEDIRIDEGRLDITPTASTSASDGGWVAQMNNFWWYAQDLQTNSGSFIFDELYNFMTSHQNPTADQNSMIRQQGVVWSLAVPDENLGWYEPDPPESTGSLNYSNTTHMPRKGFALMATLGGGSGYNRASSPLSEWIVPNDFGQTNGMGTGAMLRAGTFGQNNGGIHGTRTIGPLFQDAGRDPQSSLFVQMAEIIQAAEDAIYGREYGTNGTGGYHDYLDIDSFIDWQIATEMTSNFELSVMNGQYMHYDPRIGKLKMGPIWDLDKAWGDSGAGGGWWWPTPPSSQAEAGFVRKSPFWYKELLGWEITGSASGNIFNHPGRNNTDRRDPYYTQQLKSRWNEVKGSFITELGPYIDAQNTRLSRIATYSRVNNQQTVTPSTTLKTTITNRVNALDSIINGY